MSMLDQSSLDQGVLHQSRQDHSGLEPRTPGDSRLRDSREFSRPEFWRNR